MKLGEDEKKTDGKDWTSLYIFSQTNIIVGLMYKTWLKIKTNYIP